MTSEILPRQSVELQNSKFHWGKLYKIYSYLHLSMTTQSQHSNRTYAEMNKNSIDSSSVHYVRVSMPYFSLLHSNKSA